MSTEVSRVTNDLLIAWLRDVVGENKARNREAILERIWSPLTSLEEIGFDSLDLVELIFLIEDRFGVDIDYNANTRINDVKTIDDLRRELEKLLADSRAA